MNCAVIEQAIFGDRLTTCSIKAPLHVDIALPNFVGAFADDITPLELACDAIPSGEAVVCERVQQEQILTYLT